MIIGATEKGGRRAKGGGRKRDRREVVGSKLKAGIGGQGGREESKSHGYGMMKELQLSCTGDGS